MEINFHANAFDSITPSLKNTIKDIWRFPRRLFRYLKKLAAYSVVLWNDYDWDYHYLLKMIQYKLSRHRKDMERDPRIKDSQKNRFIKQMRTCELLLDRLIKCDYWDSLSKNYDKKWGEAEFSDEPTEDPNLFKLNIKYPGVTSPELEEQRRKEFKELVRHEDMLKKQDIEYFCKIFSKHYNFWWT